MTVDELLRETDLTTIEIAVLLGMTAGELRDVASLSDIQLEARDTQIKVYNLVGHDGSNVRDTCARCGIILLRDYSKIPAKWGEHQRAVGNICKECSEYMIETHQAAHGFLHTCSCHLCPCGDIQIYYYQSAAVGYGEIYPYRAVPLCHKHEETFYESKKSALVRDFLDGLPDDIVRGLFE